MKQKTLSEKGFEIDPNSPNYNTAYYEEDVKEFIKEILDEIDNLINKIDEAHSRSSIKDVRSGRSSMLVMFHNELCELKQIIKEKSGFEDLE